MTENNEFEDQPVTETPKTQRKVNRKTVGVVVGSIAALLVAGGVGAVIGASVATHSAGDVSQEEQLLPPGENPWKAVIDAEGVINDVDPATVPWRTTGWETHAASCSPTLDQVVRDYREITQDPRSDSEWAVLVAEATAHCPN